MTQPAKLTVVALDLDAIAAATGRVAVVVSPEGTLGQAARRINRLSKGALARFVESDAFEEMAEGEAKDLAYPAGMEAEAVQVVKLSNQAPALRRVSHCRAAPKRPLW
eukprot:TRINITY_DN11092_c0_g1_i2.p1 TRINITY_DN11092_c0_g1~~TRINITY_DN11092_c0_g1_i2.p1  ORF type:complete len:108 (+),score=11.52 TRINITY_DN11092_c0_g1_i2:3-326(+)